MPGFLLSPPSSVLPPSPLLLLLRLPRPLPSQIRDKLLYHVSEGYHEEQGIVNVYALDGVCPQYTPLVVPSVDEESQFFVNHPSAVAAFRAELATFLEERVGRQLDDRNGELLPLMNQIGQRPPPPRRPYVGRTRPRAPARTTPAAPIPPPPA